jgi:hypothetical protein
LPNRPSALAPEVSGLGTSGVTPVASQARISSPLKYAGPGWAAASASSPACGAMAAGSRARTVARPQAPEPCFNRRRLAPKLSAAMAALCPAPRRFLKQQAFVSLRFLAQATGLKHLGSPGFDDDVEGATIQCRAVIAGSVSAPFEVDAGHG